MGERSVGLVVGRRDHPSVAHGDPEHPGTDREPQPADPAPERRVCDAGVVGPAKGRPVGLDEVDHRPVGLEEPGGFLDGALEQFGRGCRRGQGGE